MRGEGGPGAINMLIVPEPVFPYYLSVMGVRVGVANFFLVNR